MVDDTLECVKRRPINVDSTHGPAAPEVSLAMRRLLVLFVVLVLGAFAFPAVAHATTFPTAVCSPILNTVGGTETITGTGYLAHRAYVIYLHWDNNGNGAVQTTVGIRADRNGDIRLATEVLYPGTAYAQVVWPKDLSVGAVCSWTST